MRSVIFSVLSALTLLTAACSDVETEDSATSGESTDALVVPAAAQSGDIAFGDAVTVAYTRTPRYRAYRFVASAGDEIRATATSTDGDAVLWLTNATFGTLIKNDDAEAGTSDARIERKLTKSGTYWLVVSEAQRKAATISLSLARKAPAADVSLRLGGKCIDLFACPVQGFSKVEGFMNAAFRFDGHRLTAVPELPPPGLSPGATTAAAEQVIDELVNRGRAVEVDDVERGVATTYGRNDMYVTAKRTTSGIDLFVRLAPKPGSAYANQSVCAQPARYPGGSCTLHVDLQ